MGESPLKQLVRGLAGYARALRGLAMQQGLQHVYNDMCDVLDTLNVRLSEDEEPVLPDWYKL